MAAAARRSAGALTPDLESRVSASAEQPPAVRPLGVVLDAYAFIKGWLLATSLWVGIALVLVAAYYGVLAARGGADGGVWELKGLVVLCGFGAASVFPAPLARVLASDLRPVGGHKYHVRTVESPPQAILFARRVSCSQRKPFW